MKKLFDSSVSRRTFLGGAAAASLLGLAACGGGGDTETPAGDDAAATTGGGTIAAGSAYAPSDYSPISTSSAFCLGANWHVLEGLYGVDYHDYTTFPELATGDPEQVDETTYTITIREGAKFSDGNPVTTEDIATAFARVNENATYAAFLAPIASVEATDDTTITVKTNYPNFTLLKERLSTVRVFPASLSDEDLAKTPVGSGPWMYETITDTAVDLVPNPNYNGSLPAEDEKLHYDILVDATARMTSFQQGQTQVMESVSADAVSTLEGAGAKIDTVDGFATRFIMFNTAKAPWDNVAARQAVLYALNTDQMISNVFGGLAKAASCYLPENFKDYQQAATVYTYDPEKAKSLLEEAGVTPGSIKLRTTDNTQVEQMAIQAEQDLSALGFTVEIATDTSAATYAAIQEGDGDFDILLAPGDASCWGNDADLLLNWWYNEGTWQGPRTRWAGSDEFKQLRELMDTALGQSGDEQAATWKQCFDLIAENAVLYPVLHVQTVTASWDDASTAPGGVALEGFSGIGTTGMSFLGAKTVSA